MLTNLMAELARKGYRTPTQAVRKALGCTDKTARNKVDGKSPITVPEAVAIIQECFAGDNFSIEYLFAQSKDTNSTRPSA
jgi:hypothetical protein